MLSAAVVIGTLMVNFRTLIVHIGSVSVAIPVNMHYKFWCKSNKIHLPGFSLGF